MQETQLKLSSRRKARREFLQGLKNGIPICLGYIPVSFAFGMEAMQGGFALWVPMLISMTNLTSAGQFAGLSIIMAGGTYIELAVTTLLINLRYMLMSLSLSQKIPPEMSLAKRCAIGFGVTDEIFAIASQKLDPISGAYMGGLILTPYFGWALGTLLGATATALLPPALKSAFGIMIYGMFLAIIIPPARESKAVLISVLIAAAISCLFRYVPFLSSVSSGWVIIISSVIAAGLCATLMPIKPKKNEEV